jgi:hypothetical protein
MNAQYNSTTLDLSYGKFLLRTLNKFASGTIQQLRALSLASRRKFPENAETSISSGISSSLKAQIIDYKAE